MLDLTLQPNSTLYYDFYYKKVVIRKPFHKEEFQSTKYQQLYHDLFKE